MCGGMNNSRYSLVNLKVGITVFIGLVIFIFFMFIVGSEGNYFSPTYKLRLFVKDVNGLATGSMVTLGGLKIGYVDDLEFTRKDEKNGIDIILKIKSKYRNQITEKSQGEVKTIGLLGDKYVDVSIGQSMERSLTENEYLTVKPSFEIADMADDVRDVMKDFKATAKAIQKLVDTVSSGKGSLSKLITSPELYDETESFMKNLNKLSVSLNSKKGSLGKLIGDDAVYNDLKSALGNIENITSSLNKGEGSFGKLLKNDSLYNELNNVTGKINNLLRKTEEKNNVVGGLVNDGELYQDFSKTVKELNQLIKEIKENPKKFFNFSVF